MSIKNRIVFAFLLFIILSCSQKEQFPSKQSEKVTLDNVVLNSSFISETKKVTVDSVHLNNFGKELKELLKYKQWFEEQNTNFDLDKMESLWGNLKSERINFNFEGVTSWISVTGFLLEITENTKYAEELERIAYQNNSSFSESEIKEIENQLIPFIFTKNVDHIHVNLFANATIKYNHTLNGAVEITQETNILDSAKIQIKFKMEIKRYIELYIRIPEWAEGATVTEKGVKYVTHPGEYCQITRKWGEGDVVEIILPTERIPE
jgi:hypothetical protein